MASNAIAVRAYPIPLQSMAFGSITGSYTIISSTGLPYPCRILNFQNATNAPIYISFDGVNDHIYLAAESFQLFDFGTNRGERASELSVSQGTKFFVKFASAPTSGLVAVSGFYAQY